ncbi:hypothetical protein PR202_ga10170 [Eleusine coracana subsp. coracana]|uniref:Transposase-associated domain-containing protein n=1 Tax=Eleusine coracana subsp. coracana TaxID=191504 RepID=A0AAV5C638_ELECO|nr:hypothetical protein PR202_ga10170 [Eleusine coracana subsp. coracana]
MDKRWMSQPMQSGEYSNGVNLFLEFAFSNSARGNKILCPCKICQNSCWRVAGVVHEHLIYDGFTEGYTIFVNHAEPSSSFVPNSMQSDRIEVENSNEEDDIYDLLRDLAGGLDDSGDLEVN